MEGAGSRLGRTPSRYGPAPVFSGPVRRWQKRWVHVPQPPPPSAAFQRPKGGGDAPRLLLCRWTPVTSGAAAAAEDDEPSSAVTEEPRRRKFRYTPVAVIDKPKKEVIEKVDDKAKPIETTQASARLLSKSEGLYGKLNITDEMGMAQTPVEVERLPQQSSFEDYLNRA